MLVSARICGFLLLCFSHFICTFFDSNFCLWVQNMFAIFKRYMDGRTRPKINCDQTDESYSN